MKIMSFTSLLTTFFAIANFSPSIAPALAGDPADDSPHDSSHVTIEPAQIDYLCIASLVQFAPNTSKPTLLNSDSAPIVFRRKVASSLGGSPGISSNNIIEETYRFRIAATNLLTNLTNRAEEIIPLHSLREEFPGVSHPKVVVSFTQSGPVSNWPGQYVFGAIQNDQGDFAGCQTFSYPTVRSCSATVAVNDAARDFSGLAQLHCASTDELKQDQVKLFSSNSKADVGTQELLSEVTRTVKASAKKTPSKNQ